MGSPKEQIIIIDSEGGVVEIDSLMEKYEQDINRILVDDEIGRVLYIGDLEYYSLKPMPDGNYLAQKLLQVRRARYSTSLIRKQIGATVLSITSDTVFLVKEDDYIKKVRADKLEKGMVLVSGEKVLS